MRLRLIFNPAAGHNRRTPGLVRQLGEFRARHSPQIELVATRAPGHATELAKDAAQRGFGAAVAVGGDGTANEVAQGLVGTECALGFVPRGSGNGLARHLGIPLRVAPALDLLVSGQARLRPIDTGAANGRLFINAMGCGLDAEIAQRFSRLERRGFLSYLRLCPAFLRDLRAEHCEITAAGETLLLDALLVCVANSPQYGNNAEIAPGARVDDGRLDLVAVRRLGALAGLGLAPRLWLGNFDRHPAVRRLAGAGFLIRRAGPGWIHTDGEPHAEAAEIRVSIRPRSLQVMAPP
ncbi:MAG: diacylglycerol kinase [Opitutus sp.]|nr:diacylglycerol kinase [Opitutus sp.]